MLKIAVCDDTSECVTALENLIKDYCDKNEIEFSLDVFLSGVDFCSAVENFGGSEKIYDIIFMDMQMPVLSGVDTINRVSDKIKGTLIFVTTSFTSFISAALRLGIFQFFSKPIAKEEFEFDFARAIEKINSSSAKLELFYNKTKFAFSYDSILYIAKQGKKLEIHFEKGALKVDERLYNACGLEFKNTENGYVVYYYGSLASMLLSLEGRGFCKCHNGIIVNLSKVYSLSSKLVSLKNGESLAVSRTHYKEFNAAFSYYLARA